MKQRVFTVSPLLFTLMLKKVYKKKALTTLPQRSNGTSPPPHTSPFGLNE